MEPDRKEAEKRALRAGNAVKWAFVIFLAASAALIVGLRMWRAHPAEKVLNEAVRKLNAGDLEGAMSFVDPQGQLGRLWSENVSGVRDSLKSIFNKHRFEFSSLKFRIRVEGSYAEAQLAGGKVTVYGKEGGTAPEGFFDLGGSDLVFYLQEKEDGWWIEGINYDLQEILSGELDWLLRKPTGEERALGPSDRAHS